MRLVAGLFALTLSTSLAFADEAKAPEPQPEDGPAKVALRVVKVMPDSHQALLYDKDQGTHVLIDEGGEIDGYTVQAIEDDNVTLAAEGMEVILTAPARQVRRPVKATRPAKRAKSIVAPVIIADENGVRTVIAPEASDAARASLDAATDADDEEAVEALPPPPKPARATKTAVAARARVKPAPAPAPADEEGPADPYFIVEPPTVTPYDEVEGEEERPADPYTLPSGTSTVTAANPYDEPPVAEQPAPPPVIVTATTAVIARRDLDAALADFGTLTRSLRGSFQPNGAKLEQVATGSVFAKAGLQVGDVITAVDGRPVRTIDDAAELYVRAQTTRATNVQILRGGQAITLKVQIR